MSYYHNDREMYIPLSIDNVETTSSSYIFSNTNIIKMVGALIPYFFLIFPFMQNGQITLIIIVTLVYLFLYSFFFRFFILEERKRRTQLREMDNNKISGLDYFWGINKIGDNEQNDGVMYFERTKEENVRGAVVTYNRGSLVGVPENSYNEYRYAKMRFLKELSNHSFDFTWYEIPVKENTIPESLVHIINRMTLMENQSFKQLIKLQLEVNVAYITGEGVGYRDFILIRNSNFKTLRRFREILETIIDNTLSHNKYILNPRVCTKAEVENFIGYALMINSVDSNSIRRNVDYKPVSTFAEVVRIVDQNGIDVPLENLDLTDFSHKSVKRSKTIEDDIKLSERNYESNRKQLDKLKKNEIQSTKTSRTLDNITDHQYHEKLDLIEEKYEKLYMIVENNRGDSRFNIGTIIKEYDLMEKKKLAEEKAKREQERKERFVAKLNIDEEGNEERDPLDNADIDIKTNKELESKLARKVRKIPVTRRKVVEEDDTDTVEVEFLNPTKKVSTSLEKPKETKKEVEPKRRVVRKKVVKTVPNNVKQPPNKDLNKNTDTNKSIPSKSNVAKTKKPTKRRVIRKKK